MVTEKPRDKEMRGGTPIDTFGWIYGPTPGNHCSLLRTQELLASCSQWLERVVGLHRETVTRTCWLCNTCR
jgi:hypothetical protein